MRSTNVLCWLISGIFLIGGLAGCAGSVSRYPISDAKCNPDLNYDLLSSYIGTLDEAHSKDTIEKALNQGVEVRMRTREGDLIMICKDRRSGKITQRSMVD